MAFSTTGTTLVSRQLGDGVGYTFQYTDSDGNLTGTWLLESSVPVPPPPAVDGLPRQYRILVFIPPVHATNTTSDYRVYGGPTGAVLKKTVRVDQSSYFGRWVHLWGTNAINGSFSFDAGDRVRLELTNRGNGETAFDDAMLVSSYGSADCNGSGKPWGTSQYNTFMYPFRGCACETW